MKKTARLLITTLLLITLTLFLISCGSNDEGAYTEGEAGMDYDRAAGSPDVADFDDSGGSEAVSITSSTVSGDKIIYRQNLSMETDNLHQTIDKMEQDLDRYGGHIHRYQVISEKEESPRGDFTLRVPSDSLKAFVDSMRNYGVFTQEVLESDDVSDTYYDIEANLRNQTIQERRLLDLLEDAENLSDVLTLESELSRIRREIERLQGTLNRLDDQIRFSTLYLSIREVESDELEDQNFSDQFFRNFRESFERFQGAVESMLLWFASYFPFILLAGIILGLMSKFYPKTFGKIKHKEKAKTKE